MTEDNAPEQPAPSTDPSPSPWQWSRRKFMGTAAALAAVAAGTTYLSLRLNDDHDGRISDLLSRMSLEDKIAQLNIPVCLPEVLVGDSPNPTGTSEKREAYVTGHTVVGVGKDKIRLGPGGGFFGLVNQTLSGSIEVPHVLTPREQAEQHNHLQKLARKTKHGIPLLQISEGTHGSVGPGSTIFPEGLGLGATFNPGLIGRAYGAVAAEARAVGIHALSTIMAELNRDPRYGRAIWSFSEDPYLTGRMVGALVPAMQADLKSNRSVITSLCTFPMESPNVGGLETSSIEIGEREFREVHLEPWRVGFTEHDALMAEASEQTIDGMVVHGSKKYLTDLLRNELRFRGVVIANDLGGLVREHVATSSREAAKLGMRAGADVSLSWDDVYLDQLAAGVRAGEIPMEHVDRAVRRVLDLKVRLGLFDNPYVDPDRAQQVVGAAEHHQLALDCARQSMVLLKNEGELLPISSKVHSIAVVGPNADNEANLLGEYNAYPPMHPTPSILAELKRQLDPAIRVTYEPGCEVSGTDASKIPAAVAAARDADLAIVVVGEQPGGGYFSPDRTDGELADTASLNLTGVQLQLVQEVHATGTPTVVVLVTGRALTFPWIADNVPAILNAWLPGEAGGTAVAEILLGKTSPSGRLPVTFPRDVGQLPMYYNQKPTRAAASEYINLPSTPQFPFGFGLTYTTFEYSNLRLSRRKMGVGDTVKVSAEITNTGKRPGTAVPQLYVSDLHTSVAVPAIRLRGIERLNLKPGQRKTVTFSISPRRDFTLVNERMRTVVEPGTFELKLGSSATEIHQSVKLTVTD